MNYLIQLIGSITIGGILTLLLISSNASVQNASATGLMDKIVQSNLTSLNEEIEYDFKKIGYRVSSNKIITADSNRIKFKTDINNDGTPDSIEYCLSETSALSGTPNPRDRLLYRRLNNLELKSSNLGVTTFKITYYDGAGNITTIPASIRYLKYQLYVESTSPTLSQFSDTLIYSGAYLERIIKPKNLK